MAETVAQDPFAEIETLKQTLHERDQHIAILEEKLRLALHKRFAASSEKASPDQPDLFNEAEATAAQAVAEEATTTVPEHKRRKRGRKPLPDHIPRTRIEHDIPEHEKICAWLVAARAVSVKPFRNNSTLFQRKSRCCSMCASNMPACLAKG
jgi:hypothetical protein